MGALRWVALAPRPLRLACARHLPCSQGRHWRGHFTVGALSPRPLRLACARHLPCSQGRHWRGRFTVGVFSSSTLPARVRSPPPLFSGEAVFKPFFYSRIYHGAHRVQVSVHIQIRKPQHLNTVQRQGICAAAVIQCGLFIIMLRPIQLNSQLGFDTVKINNVVTQHTLPIKFYRIFPQKLIPQTALLASHVFSQLTGIWCKSGVVSCHTVRLFIVQWLP